MRADGAMIVPLKSFKVHRLHDVDGTKYHDSSMELGPTGEIKLMSCTGSLVRTLDAAPQNVRMWTLNSSLHQVTFVVGSPAFLVTIQPATEADFDRFCEWRQGLKVEQARDSLPSQPSKLSPTTPKKSSLSPSKRLFSPPASPIKLTESDDATSRSSLLADFMRPGVSSPPSLSQFRSSFSKSARPALTYGRRPAGSYWSVITTPSAPSPTPTPPQPRKSTFSPLSKSPTTLRASPWTLSGPSSSPPMSVTSPLTPQRRHEGLRNLGNSCYMNATVQALASLWPLVADISSDDVRDGLQDESLLAALIDLLSEMGKGGAVSPVRFSGIALKALAFEEGRQQDAHEFLLAALNHMDGETDKSTVLGNFDCAIRNTVICDTCHHTQVITDDLTDLTLQLPEISLGGPPSCTLTDMLTSAFADEKVDYSCSNCGGKKATLKHKMAQLPRVLAVHLSRFRVIDGFVDKNEQPVAIASMLDLDAFCTKETREPKPINSRLPLAETTANKRRRRLFDDPITIDPDEQLNAAIEQSIHDHEAHMAAQAARRYRLVSIVSHVGSSASSGHYVCDVADEKGATWTCRDDDRATVIGSVGRVLAQRRQEAYMLFYISEGLSK